MKKIREKWVPETSKEMAEYLKDLHKQREDLKTINKSSPRRRKILSSSERLQVLEKTANRCHICGGQIEDVWEADHVLAHSGGGEHSVDNYLPAHRICNNYRWDYISQEFQEILRMGVWLRNEVEIQSPIGKQAGEAFIKKEKRRLDRRKKVSE